MQEEIVNILSSLLPAQNGFLKIKSKRNGHHVLSYSCHKRFILTTVERILVSDRFFLSYVWVPP